MDRFSLLLLEPGEIYFEDFKVVHHVRPEDKVPAVHNEVPGRLKICSKSLVFVPASTALPMLKFCLADCTTVEEWTPRSFQSSLASKRELMVVMVNQTIEMLRYSYSWPNFNVIHLNSSFFLQGTTSLPHSSLCGQRRHMCSASHTGRLQNALARYQPSFAA